jgi:hypothetical protein
LLGAQAQYTLALQSSIDHDWAAVKKMAEKSRAKKPSKRQIRTFGRAGQRTNLERGKAALRGS